MWRLRKLRITSVGKFGIYIESASNTIYIVKLFLTMIKRFYNYICYRPDLNRNVRT